MISFESIWVPPRGPIVDETIVCISVDAIISMFQCALAIHTHTILPLLDYVQIEFL